MGKIKTAKINYALPGEPMTQEEMDRSIREAQNGKFHSMQELKQKISEWKTKYAK